MLKSSYLKAAAVILLNVFLFNLSAAADDDFLNGMASLSCSGALIKLGQNPGQIYLLTNGHCHRDLLQEAYATRSGEIVYNKIRMPSALQIKVYGHQGTTNILPFSEVTYSTMSKTDISLFKSDYDEEELLTRGINIFSLEDRPVVAKEPVRVVSGYWHDSNECYVDQKIPLLKEFIWSWKSGFSLTSQCEVKSGWSGSPVLTKSGKIIGVVNTVNEKNLDNCSLSNPCEVEKNGRTHHRFNIGYAQETMDILSCVHDDGTFDLGISNCRLPKPKNFDFLSVTTTVNEDLFQKTLENLNLRVTPKVKQNFNKHFLATGDWPKEYSKTSSGGSFYHPVIPGVSSPDSWGVHITGWLAREPLFTPDAISFTLCHELGHHIYGGSAEDKADNFAPTCLRWAWSDSENLEWQQLYGATVNKEHQKDCQKAKSKEQLSFCLRSLSALYPVEQFRIKAWKGIGISHSQITQITAERKAEVLKGIFSQ